MIGIIKMTTDHAIEAIITGVSGGIAWFWITLWNRTGTLEKELSDFKNEMYKFGITRVEFYKETNKIHDDIKFLIKEVCRKI